MRKCNTMSPEFGKIANWRGVFKIYDVPESPNGGAIKIYGEALWWLESPNEGGCLRYMVNRNRKREGVFKIYNWACEQHPYTWPHVVPFKLCNYSISNFQTFNLSDFRARNSADFRTFHLDAFQPVKLCKLSIFRILKLANFQSFDLWNFQTFELETSRSLKPSNSQTRDLSHKPQIESEALTFQTPNFRTVKVCRRTSESANFQSLKLSNFEGRSNSTAAKAWSSSLKQAVELESSRVREIERLKIRVWKVRSLTLASLCMPRWTNFRTPARFEPWKVPTFKLQPRNSQVKLSNFRVRTTSLGTPFRTNRMKPWPGSLHAPEAHCKQEPDVLRKAFLGCPVSP